MNDMENKKIKKGDTCVVIDRYSNSKVSDKTETKVIRAGSKWIYVEWFNKTNKFDAETLRADWGGYDLFIGTLEEYNEAMRINQIKNKLEEEIKSSIGKLSVGNLQKVKDLVESLVE